MPYRRLPNTDNSRLKALNTALAKGKELPPFKLAFSQGSYRRLQAILPKWEKSLTEYKNTYSIQIKNNKEYVKKLKKAKLYISHFIQVVNMAITRGEMKEETRSYYGLDKESKRLPSLNTENDILKWGEQLVEGEKKRKMQGHSPVTNPTIAVVKVNYDNFIEAYKFQKTLQKNHARALDHISSLRPEADEIIVNIWNEVEDTFKDLPEDVKRERAQEYGVVYVYRKNELGRISLFPEETMM